MGIYNVPTNRIGTLLCLLPLGLLGGCLLHPVNTNPDPSVAIPGAYSSASATGGIGRQAEDPTGKDAAARRSADDPAAAPPFDARRDAFAADDDLTGLIAQALVSNLTIAQVEARLAQVRTGIGTAVSELLPTVSVSGTSTKPFIDGAPNTRVEAATATGALNLDLFGERISAISAARQDAVAASLNLANAKLQLAHDIAEAYFDAAQTRQNIDLIDFQLELAGELLGITEIRFGQGAGSLADILQQEELIASLESQRPPLLSNLRIAENELDALLGQIPDGADRTEIAELAYPTGNFALGTPASLLERRPDLQAAQATLVAADYRVAEAVADFFPDISISGMLSVPNLAFASTMIWTAAAQATQVIINGGRRLATVRRQGAVVEEQTAAYAQAWIGAIGEIENAVSQEQNQRELIARLDRQAELGTAALAATRDRYLQGSLTYVTVLAALQSVQNTERSLITAKRQLIGFRLDLLRALGLTPAGETVLQPAARDDAAGAATQHGNPQDKITNE